MNQEKKDILQRTAHTIRALSLDAIAKNKSGHPGMVLGIPELTTYLYSEVMKHNPGNPDWPGRDRFVLSAGHGSMLLYSILHICGYDIPMDEIASFRQLHAKTPGHPEYGLTPGVETTTGPLGQGVAAGLGMALAQKLARDRFGRELFPGKVWVLLGDGCLMEGISAEASSLAGTLGLDNLVLIYDSNDVCLDGPVSEVLTEDTAARYRSYGFQVHQIDAYNFDEMEAAFGAAKSEDGAPTLIIAKSEIGKYWEAARGSCKAHGGGITASDVKTIKHAFSWTHPPFTVPDDVQQYFRKMRGEWQALQDQWTMLFDRIADSDPGKKALYSSFAAQELSAEALDALWELDVKPDQPGRKYSEAVLNKAAELFPWIISGSADLSSCDYSWLPASTVVSKNDWSGRQIKFGVREFLAAAAGYGMSLFGFFRPFIDTFLTFSDYMKNAIRLAALMKQRVVYIFSHDSFLLGQDGPTHQPVEHLMSLRLIPNLVMLRPGDENEMKAAYIAALKLQDGPAAICFSRQQISSTVSSLTAQKAREGVERGAYLLYGDENSQADILIIATGSEIHLAVQSARLLEKKGYMVRVVSMPSWELFERQDQRYRSSVLECGASVRVSIEAGASLGWQKYVGTDGLTISLDTFGESAPTEVLAGYYGFTPESVAGKIESRVRVSTSR